MKKISEGGGWAGYGVIFSIGFFALVAQALLFRNFLTVFEGNEVGVACFFSSWLLWVAVGALAARARPRIFDALCEYFEFLPLLYIPAFMLQAWLIDNARLFAGVQPYEIFPLAKTLPVSFLLNAPISVCTGLLFALACKWMSPARRIPAAKVYIWESIGSSAGGVMTTLLLASGTGEETVFLCAALLLTMAFGLYRFSGRAYGSALVPVLVALTAWMAGFAHIREHSGNLRIWRKASPPEAYQGAFTTPQAKYLYGEYRGQFNVMAWESVADSIPNTEHASQVIALHLSQHPRARTFLVIGPGSFSLCKRLTALPQAETITWLDTDPDYPERLLNVLPARFLAGVERIEIPGMDARRYLTTNRRKYDLVILNLPDVATLALNRYFTREFFALLKEHLFESGVVGVRVSAGENFMGDELIGVGASIFSTLNSVFRGITLKPGDETWLMASDAGGLSASPAVLRDRFRTVTGAEEIYPSEGLMSLYLPDRIKSQMDYYRAAVEKLPENQLLNTDRRPKSLFYSILFAARQAGAAVRLAAGVRTFAMSGGFAPALAISLYALLRFFYLLRGRSGRNAGKRRIQAFDNHFLILSTGAVSMALNIILMFMYQSLFGSLFLYVGLISALLMLGLALGGMAGERLVASERRDSRSLLALGLLLHLAFTAIIFLLPYNISQPAFAALFLVSGLLGGIYVPIAGAALKTAGLAPGSVGASIELNDHLGGAVGALATGLVLLPMFGNAGAVGVAALFLAVNFIPLLPMIWGAGDAPARARPEGFIRATNYIMFGAAAFLMISSLRFHFAGKDALDRLFLAATRSMSENAEPIKERHSLKNGKTIDYYVLHDASSSTETYFFCTEKLAPNIHGYGGAIVMTVKMGEDGALRDFRIIESNETPVYLNNILASWLKSLLGKKIFGANSLKGVDTMTGATLTSSAVIRTLKQAGGSFAQEVMEMDVHAASVPEPRVRLPEMEFLALIALAAVSLLMRGRSTRRVRRLFLLLVVILLGYFLNTQYSSAQVFSLLGLKLPPSGWTAAFALALVVPCFVLLFDNVYCSYLCPFGALQELVGDLRPGSLKTSPDARVLRRASWTKFVVLFVLVVLYALTLDLDVASQDPLVTAFGKGKTGFVLLIVVSVIALSFFYKRFWCRNLCPAGAFLSLLNGLRLTKRLFRPMHRHRMESEQKTALEHSGMTEIVKTKALTVGSDRNSLYLALVLGLALVFIGHTISTLQAGRKAAASGGAFIMTGGRARAIDVKRFKWLIEQRRLSDREAMHYRPVPGAVEHPMSR